MMGPAVSVVGTVAVVAVGRWSQDKKIEMRFVIGSGIYAVIVSLIGSANEKLASQIALLVFVTSFFIYIQRITLALGLTKRADGDRNRW